MTDALRLADSQDYIADRLTAAERAAFEARLLTDPRVAGEIETSLRLREGLEALRDEQALHALTHSRRRPFFAVFASAAALALVALIVYMGSAWMGSAWMTPDRGRPAAVMAASLSALRGQAGSPVTVTGRHAFALMRSATQTPTIALPPTGALELRALVPAGGVNPSYRTTVELIRPPHPTSRIGVVDHAVPDADGFVALYVNAAGLEPGDYALLVQPESAGSGDPGERFEFKLRRPDAAAPKGR